METRYFGAIGREGNGMDGLVKIENGSAWYFDKKCRDWVEDNACFYVLMANVSFREIGKAEADSLMHSLGA